MNLIIQYFHCKQCLKERPEGTSMRDFARLEVGTTIRGLQVCCVRHNCNIVALDYKGALIGLDPAGTSPAYGPMPERSPWSQL